MGLTRFLSKTPFALPLLSALLVLAAWTAVLGAGMLSPLPAVAAMGTALLTAGLALAACHAAGRFEAEHLASFPRLNPQPVVEVRLDGSVSYVNAAARAAMPDLESAGAAHPFFACMDDWRVALRQGDGTAYGRCEVGDVIYEQDAFLAPDGETIRIYGRDVTRREKAREALQASEDRFNLLFRISPVGMCVSRVRDGRFLEVNERFARLLGYTSPDEIVGRTAVEIGMWDDETRQQRIAELLQRAHRATRIVKVRTRSGQVRRAIGAAECIEFNGETCIVGMLLDIEERERLRAEVKAERDFARSIIDTVGQGLLISDAQYRVQYVNPALLKMTGYTHEEALQLDPIAYLHPEDRAQVLADRPGRREGEGSDLYDARVLRKDGTYLDALVAAVPRLVGGEYVGTTTVVVDMTMRKHYEAALIQARDKAEELSALKSTFIANISHEVRTPLTAVIGFAEVLRDEIEQPQLRELATLIRQSGQRLLETLNSVLDFAQIQAGGVELHLYATDLIPLTRITLNLFRPLADLKHLVLHGALPDQPLRAMVNGPAFDRIMNNLLSNAIKFTDEGTVRVEMVREGDRAVVKVVDTGIGMDEAFLGRAFEEFRQESVGLARSHPGSGLGLAIVKRLVEMMHGTIAVESEKGRGTTVTVTFPMAGEA